MASIFAVEEAFLSHRNNIVQKTRIAPNGELQGVCSEIERRYNLYLSSIQDSDVLAGHLAPSIEAVGTYLDFAKAVEKEHSFFNWRSDYASSILPEYLYRIFGISLKGLEFPHCSQLATRSLKSLCRVGPGAVGMSDGKTKTFASDCDVNALHEMGEMKASSFR